MYTFKDGLLYCKDQIYVPDEQQWRTTLMTEFHSTPTAGHSGMKPTLSRLSASFLWPGSYTDVKQFIRNCHTCQHNKYMPTKKQGLLQPLPIPDKVWDELTMDFVTHLPASFGHTVVLVICDRLSKYVHFIALPTKFAAKDLANRFSSEVCRLHGIPKTITSDRDPLFLSQFWKELFRTQGIIRRPTVKPKWLTEVWRRTFVVLQVTNPNGGSNSFTWQNSGTIPRFTQLFKCLLLKLYMDAHLPLSWIT
jgi:hypothetical protein